MTVNPGVARFEQFAHETVAQIQDTLRTFHRVVGPSCRTHLTFLIEAMRQHVNFVRSQGTPLLRALRQRVDEALSRQSHLRLLATRARNDVHAILQHSEPFLHKIRHLCGTPSSYKTVPTLMVVAFVGLVLTILILLKMGASNQASNEHVGTVQRTTSSPTQAPDWTIFDDAFAKVPTRLATSEFADRVRTSGAALTPEPAETSGQVIRELVPLPRPRPRLR
jgi:hypothetical protein